MSVNKDRIVICGLHGKYTFHTLRPEDYTYVSLIKGIVKNDHISHTKANTLITRYLNCLTDFAREQFFINNEDDLVFYSPQVVRRFVCSPSVDYKIKIYDVVCSPMKKRIIKANHIRIAQEFFGTTIPKKPIITAMKTNGGNFIDIVTGIIINTTKIYNANEDSRNENFVPATITVKFKSFSTCRVIVEDNDIEIYSISLSK